MKKSDKIKLSIAGVAFVLGAVFLWTGLKGAKQSERIEQEDLPPEAKEPPKPEKLDKNRRLIVGLLVRRTRSPYSRGLYVGAVKAAKGMKDVIVIFGGMQDESNPGVQNNIIYDMRHNGANAFVVIPCNRKTIVGRVNKAVKEQTPVIVADTPLDSKSVVGFVPADHAGAGAAAATHLGQLLAGKGQVAVLRNVKGMEYSDAREKAFLKTLKEKFPHIQLVSSDQYAGTKPEDAKKKAAALLKKHPKLDGVFCSNDTAAEAMLSALQASKRAGKVKFVACDSSPALLKGLAAGQVNALIVMNTIALGEQALKALVAHIRETGEKPPTESVKAFVVTKETMNQPEFKELLNPDPKKYLPKQDEE